eukprot:m.224527 g.224527  ORF g.224527 m.224527 type:complete len:957 (-) comp33433_c1_seq1:38-2908(-)
MDASIDDVIEDPASLGQNPNQNEREGSEESEGSEDESEEDHDPLVATPFVGKVAESGRVHEVLSNQPPAIATKLKAALVKMNTMLTASTERESHLSEQTRTLTQNLQEKQLELEAAREAQQRTNEVKEVLTRYAALEAEAQRIELEVVDAQVRLEAISDGPDSFEMSEASVAKKDIRECQEEITERREEKDALTAKCVELEQITQEFDTATLALAPDIEELETRLVVESALPQRVAKQAEHQFAHAIKSYKLQLDEEKHLANRLRDDFEAGAILRDRAERRGMEVELEYREYEASLAKEFRKESRCRIQLQQLKTSESDMHAEKIALNTQLRTVAKQTHVELERKGRLARQRESGLQKLKIKETRIAQALEIIDLDTRKAADLKLQIKAKSRELSDLDKAIDASTKQRDKFGTQEKTSAAIMESETDNMKQKTSAVNEKEKHLVTLKHELSELGWQERMMRRAVDAAATEVLRAHDNADTAENELLEAVNIKDDAVKTHSHLMAAQDDFGRLYQMIKNDKNKLASQILSCQQRLREMKEKVRILTNEMEILQSSVHERDVRLNTTTRKWEIEEEKKKKVKALRDKEKQHFDELRDKKKNTLSENSLRLEQIKVQEMRHNLTETKYNRTVQARNEIGERYIERVNELRNFYEKMNVCSGILRNGVVQLQDREEEIRFLKLEERELTRGKELLLRQQPIKHSLQAELIDVLQHILTTQQAIAKMEHSLEAASDESTTRRMRLTGMPQPSEDKIDSKLEVVAEQLAKKEQRVIELHLVLLETQRLAERSSKQVTAATATARVTATSISDAKAKIIDANRKLMALVSEVSMHQGNCIKFEQTAAEQREEVEQAKVYMDFGEAPTEDAKREWERECIRIEQHRMAREMEELGMDVDDDADDGRELADGTLTFAEIRPSAYLPDMRSGALPKPRPYGRDAPFKPSHPSNHLRFYKKPLTSDS